MIKNDNNKSEKIVDRKRKRELKLDVFDVVSCGLYYKMRTSKDRYIKLNEIERIAQHLENKILESKEYDYVYFIINDFLTHNFFAKNKKYIDFDEKNGIISLRNNITSQQFVRGSALRNLPPVVVSIICKDILSFTDKQKRIEDNEQYLLEK